MKKIYIASSWKNALMVTAIAKYLRLKGHEVYDFTNPPVNTAFHWNDISKDWQRWSFNEFKKALDHPIAEAAYQSDFNAMRDADICVLLLPAGNSAHTEAGWMKGNGKKVFLYYTEDQRPELMYKIYDGMTSKITELTEMIGE